MLDPGFGTLAPWDERRANVARTITASAASIVCLQEAEYTPLAKQLGMVADLVRLTALTATDAAADGVTFLHTADWHPVRHGWFRLPRTRGDHRRSAVWLELAHDDGIRLLLVGTHLTYIRDKHRSRARQARSIVRRIRRLNRRALPVVVLGDFNSFDSRAAVTPSTELARAGFRGAAKSSVDRIAVSESVGVDDSGVTVLEGVASDHRLLWADLRV